MSKIEPELVQKPKLLKFKSFLFNDKIEVEDIKSKVPSLIGSHLLITQKLMSILMLKKFLEALVLNSLERQYLTWRSICQSGKILTSTNSVDRIGDLNKIKGHLINSAAVQHITSTVMFGIYIQSMFQDMTSRIKIFGSRRSQKCITRWN